MQIQFVSYDTDEIAERLALDCSEEYLYINLLDIQFRVGRKNGLVENLSFDAGLGAAGESTLTANVAGSDNSACIAGVDAHDSAGVACGKFMESDFNGAMTVYDVLCYSKVPVFPSGNFVNMQSLSPVQKLAGNTMKGFFGKVAEELDGRDLELSKALEKMGGVPEGKGDVSYSLPFFKDFRCMFQFWDSDDEFAPSIQIFWDSAILSLMHYETVWYANNLLVGRVKALL